MSKMIVLFFLLAALSWGNEALAQAPSPPPAPPPPYGAPINLADAKKAADAAVAEVAKVGSAPDAIAIVDHGGFLIYFERMDNTSLGAVENAINKARSAALFRRPTKVFEDALAGGGNGVLALRGAVPLEVACRSFRAANSSARSASAAGRRSRTARSPRRGPTRSSRAAPRNSAGAIRISEP
jgi:hypothetical protein